MKIPGIAFARGWAKSFEVKGKTSINEYASFLGWNFVAIIVLFLASNKGYIPPQAPFIYLVADIIPMTSLALRRLNDAEEPWSKALSRNALNKNSNREPLQWHTKLITRDIPKIPGIALLISFLWIGSEELGVGLFGILLIFLGFTLIATTSIAGGALCLTASGIIFYYTRIALEDKD